MQKLKRIAALIGAVFLIGLYVVTLILALTGSSASQNMLMASIICTVLVSVLAYAMMLAARMLEHPDENDSDARKADPNSRQKKQDDSPVHSDK
ncbi:MAG: hypothetical protein LUH07_02735 [Lachnospiraceae bacterium]|nr:hypothetical protein [Lachnospiraceae bacterium]